MKTSSIYHSIGRGVKGGIAALATATAILVGGCADDLPGQDYGSQSTVTLTVDDDATFPPYTPYNVNGTEVNGSRVTTTFDPTSGVKTEWKDGDDMMIEIWYQKDGSSTHVIYKSTYDATTGKWSAATAESADAINFRKALNNGTADNVYVKVYVQPKLTNSNEAGDEEIYASGITMNGIAMSSYNGNPNQFAVDLSAIGYGSVGATNDVTLNFRVTKWTRSTALIVVTGIGSDKKVKAVETNANETFPELIGIDGIAYFHVTARSDLHYYVETEDGAKYPSETGFSPVASNYYVIDVTPISHGDAVPDQEYTDEVENGPIPIYNATQLAKIGKDDAYPLTGEYVLMNDIDMSAKAATTENDEGGNGGAAWKPIGKYANGGNDNMLTNSGYSFTGKFNGNGKTISNLKIQETVDYSEMMSYAGLFAQIGKDGIVYNLHLTGMNISVNSSTGTNYTGGIAGNNIGRIDLCSVTGGTISGKSSNSAYVGGIAGYMQNSTACISRCHVDNTTISATGNDSQVCAGGIVAESTSGSRVVVACYTTGCTVTADAGSGSNANAYAGGLMGENGSSGNVFGSYAKDANAFAKGNATNTGSLIGENWGTVTSCYSTEGTGTVPTNFTDTDKATDSIGSNSGTISNCVGTGSDFGSDYTALTSGSNSMSVAPITANDNGSLNVGEAVNWTATGIWGGTVSNASTPPNIKLDYNGGT